MSDANALMLSIFCVAVMYLLWRYVFERLPLEQLGPDRVRQALKAEPAWRREKILARGWVTRDEWFTIRVRQMRGDSCNPSRGTERDGP